MEKSTIFRELGRYTDNNVSFSACTGMYTAAAS